MMIFGWMQSKINGKQTQNRPSTKMGSHQYLHSMSDSRKDEFSDWPDGLLAIGTFGNHQRLERCESSERSNSSYDLSDFTQEEVGKLQMELAKLLKTKPLVAEQSHDDRSMVATKASLPLDRFLNCPSSLEVDRRSTAGGEEAGRSSEERSEEFARSISLVKSKGKDVRKDNSNTMRKMSASFLLKKVFACRGGFAPTPSLRDPIPESRVEKMLRTILHKKMYSQSSTHASSKKYLGSRHVTNTNEKDDHEDQKRAKSEKLNDGSKWVKTDSDFIVLEI